MYLSTLKFKFLSIITTLLSLEIVLISDYWTSWGIKTTKTNSTFFFLFNSKNGFILFPSCKGEAGFTPSLVRFLLNINILWTRWPVITLGIHSAFRKKNIPTVQQLVGRDWGRLTIQPKLRSCQIMRTSKWFSARYLRQSKEEQLNLVIFSGISGREISSVNRPAT